MEREETTLATEIFHELKASMRRWFIAFIVMVILEALTVAGFIWYITLPAADYDIEQTSTDRSFNLINGRDTYGGDTEDSLYP